MEHKIQTREQNRELNNDKKGENEIVPLFSAVEKKCAVGVARLENLRGKSIEAGFENYSKRLGAEYFYLRIYLLFFFLGAFLFTLGKWNVPEYAEMFLKSYALECDGMLNLSVGCFPLVALNFALLVFGFTVYSSVVTCVASAVTFFSAGAVCAYLVSLGGSMALLWLELLTVGVICFLFIMFCCVSKGISYVASHGVSKLCPADGVMYFITFFCLAFLQDFLFKILCFFIKDSFLT